VNLLIDARRGILLAALFCTCLCLAQTSDHKLSNQSDVTIRTTSRLVTVDVVVTENNRPVKGLTKDSFRILENGKEQEIKTFEEFSSSGGPQLSASVSAAGFSAGLPPHIYTNAVPTAGPPNVLLLDALNTPVQDQQYLHKQIVACLKEIPPGTRIAIFTLGTRLRMVQGFTTDIALLQAVIDGRRATPDSSVLLDQQSDLATPMDSSSNQNALDVLDQFQAEITAFRYDMRVQTTLDAMKQLAAFLSLLPGRKNVVWLSGSFPLTLSPDETANNPFLSQRVYTDQLQQISDAFAANRISVYPVDVRGILPPAMFSAQNASGGSSGAPMRRGARGGPPGMLRAQHQSLTTASAEHATMVELARDTGGRAFYETNGLKQAIASALDDGASYYTLTYAPVNKDFNSKFRKIEIKLQSGNFHLAYRHGYYARPVQIQEGKPADLLISPKDPAIQAGAPPATQILFKTRVLPASDPVMKLSQPRPGPAGIANPKGPVTRYFVDFFIAMDQIATETSSDHLYHSGMEVLAIAYDPDGKPLNLVDHPFELKLTAEDYSRLLHEGLPLHEEIDVPASGTYLRVAVHDLKANHLGSLEVPIGRDLHPKQP
jgi:VWFA-related protein